MANRDSSVINVPPTFKCLKDRVLDICYAKGNHIKIIPFQKISLQKVTNAMILRSWQLQEGKIKNRWWHTSWTTPSSVIPVKPHNEIDVRLPIHFAYDILISPASVIWQLHRLLGLKNTNIIPFILNFWIWFSIKHHKKQYVTIHKQLYQPYHQ